jgi:hypothetical protein
MLPEHINGLLLGPAIAFSWVRFSTIFSSGTNQATLLSTITTLATTVCLSASALALGAGGVIVGSMTILLGLTAAAALEFWQVSSAIRITVATACLLTYLALG